MASKFLFIFSNPFSGLEIFNVLLKDKKLYNGEVHPLNYTDQFIDIEDLIRLKNDILMNDQYKFKGIIIMPTLFLAIELHYKDLFNFLGLSKNECEFVIYTRKEIEEQIMSIVFASYTHIWDFYFNYNVGIKNLLTKNLWIQNYEHVERELFFNYKMFDDFLERHSLVPFISDFESVISNSKDNFFNNYFSLKIDEIPAYYINNFSNIKEILRLHLNDLIMKKIKFSIPKL